MTKMLLDADRVIRKFEQWNGEDADRASSAAKTRADIGELVEATGYNKKALSDGRKLLKMHEKDPDALQDYLRTFKPLLADIETHIAGQSTPDMFETPDAIDDAPAEPVDDASDNIVAFGEIAEETAAFEAAMGETLAAE